MSDSRIIKRLRQKEAKKLLSRPLGSLKQISLKDCNPTTTPSWLTRAYSNNRYCVTIQDDAPTSKGLAIRVMIQRWDDQPLINHWREIQNIKNEIFGVNVIGIEYFPKEDRLVDQKNIYWLWIFPDGILPEPF